MGPKFVGGTPGVLWGAIRRPVAESFAGRRRLVILNTSLFFLTGAVQSGGYYWPIYSLGLLGIVEVLFLLPLGLNRRLWFYLVAVAFGYWPDRFSCSAPFVSRVSREKSCSAWKTIGRAAARRAAMPSWLVEAPE